jgi:dipeptidyl aminopeptidase/acylaminoacyl peptidase
MKNTISGIACIFLLFFGCIIPGYGDELTELQLIPRQVLFGNPVKTNVRLSPNGKYLAYLAPVDGVMNLWVKTVGKDDDHPVTTDKDQGIRFYVWAGNNKYLLYAQDIAGNENWRLYRVDISTQAVTDMTPFENTQVQMLETNDNFPDEILLSMNKDNPQAQDVYRLDLGSGQLNLVAKNAGTVIDWIIDPEFKVRAAITASADGGHELYVRNSETENWRRVAKWDSENSMNSAPSYGSPETMFSGDGEYLIFLDSRDYNAGRLIKMDLATGKMDVLAEDEQYDVDDILVHPQTCEIQAVSFEKSRREWLVLDESLKDDFQTIKNTARGDFSILDRVDADRVWLIVFERDNGADTYYLYNRNTQQCDFLFSQRPELDKYTLAPMEPISFTARDGLTIHGYITYPVNKDRKNLPMVLDVHGGPWARDRWRYDPRAQWLANRGYACLQINFRGSAGYGKDFINAGDKEWGQKCQYDLVDGVNWAIEQGIADPEKIAIYGESYGGYTALCGATFTPDLFCCAVDAFGPSNLISFIKALPSWYTTLLATIYKRVGNPETEGDFLRSRSPLFSVDKIKSPVLIAQGANDVRVKQEESDQIVAALEKAGIDHEYIVFSDEGHGFRKPENRLVFYTAVEKFLAEHLGGTYEEDN